MVKVLHKSSKDKLKNINNFKERDLQSLIGLVLRGGMLLSLIVVLIGLVLYLFQQGNLVQDFTTFNPVHFYGIKILFVKLSQGSASAIIQLGVLLLIATPIVRVAMAMIGFYLEKDSLYVIISLIILAVIAFSVFYGAVE